MSKIYTKNGDSGMTSLTNGEKLSKSELRFCVIGALDELNAVIGMSLSQMNFTTETRDQLLRIQGELFFIGAELANPGKNSMLSESTVKSMVTLLENEIDSMEQGLNPLKSFILPGGNIAAAILHYARTVCRRFERELVRLDNQEKILPEILQYINRLSDFMFVCARSVNKKAGIADTIWKNSD